MQKPNQENLEQASYSNQRYPQEMRTVEQQDLEQDLEQGLYSTHVQTQEPTHWEPAGKEDVSGTEEIDETSLPQKSQSSDRKIHPYNGVRPEQSAANIVPSRERFQVPPAVERTSPTPASSRNEPVSWKQEIVKVLTTNANVMRFDVKVLMLHFTTG